ncbi:PAS domain-containing protein [bacterium]|nr:PAS domain-containing protein [bacterium]
MEIPLRNKTHELPTDSHWLSAIFENMPLGLLLVSRDGSIVRANDSFLKAFGCDSVEKKQLCEKLEPWGSIEGFCKRFSHCIEKIAVEREIFELPDGRFFEVIFVPVKTNEHLTSVLILFEDVTSDEIATQRLDAIIEIFDEAIVILDKDYKFVWANNIFKRMFTAKEDFIGKACYSIFKDKEDFCKSCTVRDSFEKGIQHLCYQTTVLKGKAKTFEILTGPLKNKTGEVIQVVKIIRDVSDRERVVNVLANTKERLENSNVQLTRRIDELAMLMELSEALQVVDNLDDNLHIFLTAVTAHEGCSFNRAFLFLVDKREKKLVGRYAVGPSSPEEAGRIWSELASKKVKSFSEALTTYQMAMAKGDIEVNSIIQNLKYNIDDREKLLIQALDSATPQTYTDAFNNEVTREFAKSIKSDSFATVPLFAMGRPVGVLVVDNIITKAEITDINLKSVRMLAGHASLAIERGILTSKIADQYEKLQSTYKKLRENQELLLRTEKLSAIGKLAAQMAHEIRNPLVSIGGFARNIAKHAPTGSSILKGASIILEETNRLEDIVDDVLSYSRSIKPNLKNYPLNSIIKRTIEMIEDQFLQANITVELDLDRNIGEVSLDPDQIRQVLLNLFKNSISAMAEGGKLSVKAISMGGFIWIDVSDTGTGIQGDNKKKIFEPFFTTKSLGTGLGLSISYQIIEAHQGMIWFSTTQNKGTTFHIKLPAKLG